MNVRTVFRNVGRESKMLYYKNTTNYTPKSIEKGIIEK